MKHIHTLAAVALATLGLSSFASAAERDVREAAEANGLTAREQRMLSGAPSSYAEYRTSYWRSRDRLRDLSHGEPRPARVKRVYVERVAAPPPPPPAAARPDEEAETFALPTDE